MISITYPRDPVSSRISPKGCETRFSQVFLYPPRYLQFRIPILTLSHSFHCAFIVPDIGIFLNAANLALLQQNVWVEHRLVLCSIEKKMVPAVIRAIPTGQTYHRYIQKHCHFPVLLQVPNAVDLDTGVVLASEIYHTDKNDTKTLHDTLNSAQDTLSTVGKAPMSTSKTEVVGDKEYHSREVLKDLENGPWKIRIREPKNNTFHSWNGDHQARGAVYNNRQRLESSKDRESERLRTELVERSNKHLPDVAQCAGLGCADERTSTRAISSRLLHST